MSWGWSDFNSASRYKSAKQQTVDTFLRTGYYLCFDSVQCASGYACIGGKCVLQSNEGTPATQCGATSTYELGVPGGCPSGGEAGCTSTGCSNNADCPCLRCCRYDRYGNVNCQCGSCPEEPFRCDPFADTYYKNVGAFFPGTQDVTCSECQSCDVFSGECAKRNPAPCWCTPCPTGSECYTDGSCKPIPPPGLCLYKTICNERTGERCCKNLTDWAEDPTHCADGSLLAQPCPEPLTCELKSYTEMGDPSTVSALSLPCPDDCTCEFVNKIGYNCTEQFGGCEYTVVTYDQCCRKKAKCTSKTVYAPLENFEVPCYPGCRCTYNGYITVGGTTAHFYTECCGEKECDCIKNPTTCDQQCAECEECKDGRCREVQTTCPPLVQPPSLANDTCFTGYFGYGCFTNITFVDYDCCYFSSFRPDGGWSGTYIGGGLVRVTSCTGAFCDVPVGGTRPVWGNIGTIFSNTQSGIVNCGCCNCSGLQVSVTYS